MENSYRKIVAQNILKLRKEAGLSELSLAARAGIDLKTLHAAEHADANLVFSTLTKIAEALDVPVVRLFEGVPGASSNLDLLADLLSGGINKK